MRVQLQQVFSPGIHIGLRGDKLKLCFKPCCDTCLDSVYDFGRTIKSLKIEVMSKKRKYTIYNVYHFTVDHSSIMQENGKFIYTVDYGDMLPHAPEADIYITVVLDMPGHCTNAIEFIGLPYGIHDLVMDFHGRSDLEVHGILDPTRFNLQTTECVS
jgi:hypothetical protein